MYNGPMLHRTHDRVSLELNRAIAARLPSHPHWIEIARANLERWQRRDPRSPELECDREWREMLSRPLGQIVEVLTSETDHARWLRQSSPFTGVLTPREVLDIKRRWR